MRSEPFPRWRWSFSLSVIAPTVILLVATAMAVTAFLVWIANGIDQRSLESQSRLAARALERQISEIPYAQESVAIWDDAIQFARFTPDKEWLDNNLGIWMGEYYGFNAVAVITDGDVPTYTMSEETSPSPEFFSKHWPVLSPLVAELRRNIRGGALDRYASGEDSQFPQVLDVKSIDGVTAVISVVPIISQTGEIEQETGT
jgi:sensor domain CHASE-containing protein